MPHIRAEKEHLNPGNEDSIVFSGARKWVFFNHILRLSGLFPILFFKRRGTENTHFK